MPCARCGEEITQPYFYDGKAFGYTCIKIVNPAYKHSKKKADKQLYAKCDSVEIKEELPNGIKARGIIGERKFIFWAKLVNGVLTACYNDEAVTAHDGTYINLKYYSQARYCATYLDAQGKEQERTCFGYNEDYARKYFNNDFANSKGTPPPAIISIKYIRKN